MNRHQTLKRLLVRKADLLTNLPTFTLALASARAWTSLVFADANLTIAPYEGMHAYFDIAYCLVSLLVALLAARMLPFFDQRWSKPAAFGCMALSSLIWAVQSFSCVESFPLTVVGTALGGAGFGLFLLLWSETLVSLSVVKIVLNTSAGMLFGSVIAFFAGGMDQLRFGVLVLTLPVIAMVALMAAHATTPESARQKPACPKFRHPWKIYLVFGVWAFAYGLRTDHLSGGAGMHSSLSTAIVSLALFAFVLLLSDRFGLSMIFRSPVLLMVCGFLLIPAEGLFGPTVSGYMISMGYSLMSTLVALLLYDMSKRLGVAIIALSGIKNAEQAFSLAGTNVSHALHESFDSFVVGGTISSVTIVMIVVVSLILFSERDFASKWGITLLNDRGAVKDALHDDSLRAVCEALSERYALSPREREILPLIAAGKTGREISEELYIAEGTCKAHTRHIYEKMGIHSRKELRTVVEAAQNGAHGDA